MTRYSRIFFDSEVSYPLYRPVLFVRYGLDNQQTPEPTATPMVTITPHYPTVTFGLGEEDHLGNAIDYSGSWEDTWVYKYIHAQDTNYGSYKSLSWREHEDYRKFTHIKVDITELHDDINILSAKLYFYVYNHILHASLTNQVLVLFLTIFPFNFNPFKSFTLKK